jgi:hypothetical protein
VVTACPSPSVSRRLTTSSEVSYHIMTAVSPDPWLK